MKRGIITVIGILVVAAASYGLGLINAAPAVDERVVQHTIQQNRSALDIVEEYLSLREQGSTDSALQDDVRQVSNGLITAEADDLVAFDRQAKALRSIIAARIYELTGAGK